ncbi:hypothetical protein [Thermoactinomyces mirandus]|uniref:Uncharacterized protein n=1 Tax=Thermoactinomyces mirandus TaxID=2756294 RepID=A0A7W1XPY3_9BACL|nr:hypothetical protein [Thermoactinomyces mirandus]MBA4601051.1 hypothetical protein [Thermoactinomyces mirandus]
MKVIIALGVIIGIIIIFSIIIYTDLFWENSKKLLLRLLSVIPAAISLPYLVFTFVVDSISNKHVLISIIYLFSFIVSCIGALIMILIAIFGEKKTFDKIKKIIKSKKKD